MIVIDVEASGVSPEKNSLLSVGAVDFLNPSRRFYEECYIWEGAHADKEALAINGFRIEDITPPAHPPSTERKGKSTDREVILAFLKWLEGAKEKTIAGHNPSFDRDFLEATAHRYHINWPLAHRSVDLHSVCYFEMTRKGIAVPLSHEHTALNLDAILRYVGVPEEPKPHNALTGALVETDAFGRLFYGRPYLEEFRKYPIPTVSPPSY